MLVGTIPRTVMMMLIMTTMVMMMMVMIYVEIVCVGLPIEQSYTLQSPLTGLYGPALGKVQMYIECQEVCEN